MKPKLRLIAEEIRKPTPACELAILQEHWTRADDRLAAEQHRAFLEAVDTVIIETSVKEHPAGGPKRHLRVVE